MVQTNGSEVKGTTTIGFMMYNVACQLADQEFVYFKVTSNEMKVNAIL